MGSVDAGHPGREVVTSGSTWPTSGRGRRTRTPAGPRTTTATGPCLGSLGASGRCCKRSAIRLGMRWTRTVRRRSSLAIEAPSVVGREAAPQVRDSWLRHAVRPPQAFGSVSRSDLHEAMRHPRRSTCSGGSWKGCRVGARCRSGSRRASCTPGPGGDTPIAVVARGQRARAWTLIAGLPGSHRRCAATRNGVCQREVDPRACGLRHGRGGGAPAQGGRRARHSSRPLRSPSCHTCTSGLRSITRCAGRLCVCVHLSRAVCRGDYAHPVPRGRRCRLPGGPRDSAGLPGSLGHRLRAGCPGDAGSVGRRGLCDVVGVRG